MAIVIYEISRKRSTMRQAISQYIKPIKHSQQMLILNNARQKHIIVLLLVKEVGPMATASVTVRVDEDTAAPQLTSWKISASISHQSRAFYRQIVREQRIPHA